MFPFRDHNPSGRTPYVTYALIGANILVWLTYFFLPQTELNEIYREWGAQPYEIMRGENLHTLITSMFMHAGPLHLAGNMLFLYIFGDNLEDYLGHFGFVLFYVIGGLGAHVLHIGAAPMSTVPIVGASGAIAAVMGGYLLLFPKARVDILVILAVFVRIVALPAYVTLLVWFGLQLVMGYLNGAGGGGVAYWAHAGGFIAGAVMILLIWGAYGKPEVWPKIAAARQAPHRPGRPRRPEPWERGEG